MSTTRFFAYFLATAATVLALVVVAMKIFFPVPEHAAPTAAVAPNAANSAPPLSSDGVTGGQQLRADAPTWCQPISDYATRVFSNPAVSSTNDDSGRATALAKAKTDLIDATSAAAIPGLPDNVRSYVVKVVDYNRAVIASNGSAAVASDASRTQLTDILQFGKVINQLCVAN